MSAGDIQVKLPIGLPPIAAQVEPSKAQRYRANIRRSATATGGVLRSCDIKGTRKHSTEHKKRVNVVYTDTVSDSYPCMPHRTDMEPSIACDV